MKVIYADFCHTIVSRYTLGWYIRFLLLRRLRLVTLLLFRFRLCSLEYAAFRATKDISIKKRLNLASAFATKLEPFIKEDVLNVILGYKSKGFRIIWVSAGLSEYIEVFTKRFDIGGDCYLTSTIDKGSFVNMYADRKLFAIRRFELANKIDFRCAISDHISDFPMLDYCNEAIVVTGPNKELIEVAKKRLWRII
jgi:phosphoserine phosphatase